MAFSQKNRTIVKVKRVEAGNVKMDSKGLGIMAIGWVIFYCLQWGIGHKYIVAGITW